LVGTEDKGGEGDHGRKKRKMSLNGERIVDQEIGGVGSGETPN